MNNKISFDVENIISSMNISKEQKEALYMRAGNFTKEDGKVIWKDGKIKCFQLYQPMEKLEIIVELG